MGFKRSVSTILPSPLLSLYHLSLACIAALLYGLPSRKITVVGVTGTKGKSSTIEFLNAIAEADGMKSALTSTIRFKIGSRSVRNTKRQTQPGRFFLQHFLSKAVQEKCTIAFIEMTSEGARQHRHRCIDLNALLFINLAPEHIESHGSLQAYSNAKFELGKQLARSVKRPRFIIANADDAESGRYLTLPIEEKLPFTLSANEPNEAGEHSGYFTFEGTRIEVKLPGDFSLKNALAAATCMRALGVSVEAIARGISAVVTIPGRTEEINEGQPFSVVVDYAHTPDSLRALYSAFSARRKICVLGSTGGGRDTWKRPAMGAIAEEFCEHIILTNEDPYDEDPASIIASLAQGIKSKIPEIIIDRRSAIRRALEIARASDVVLITGKGTDPTIQGARGTSIPWNDAEVVREEIRKLNGSG